MTRDKELQFILDFVKGNEFDDVDEVCCVQLRSLWTAYCLHHDLLPDTAQYDSDFLKIWEVMDTENPAHHTYWSNQSCFDWWMGENLC